MLRSSEAGWGMEVQACVPEAVLCTQCCQQVSLGGQHLVHCRLLVEAALLLELMFEGCVLAAAHRWAIDATGLRWVASQVIPIQAEWDVYEASYQPAKTLLDVSIEACRAHRGS